MSHLSEQIDSLALQIERHERNPRSFNAAAFLSDFSHLTDTFDLIRNNDERRKEVDQRLYHQLCSRELDTSSLRFVTYHILATTFEFYANRGGAFDETYAASCHSRRDAANDASFLQFVLLPRLLDPVSLEIPLEVRAAFLCRVAQLQNDGEDRAIFGDNATPGDIEGMNKETFVLGLFRRWLGRSRSNLSQDARCIENRLFHNGTFERLARFDSVMKELLGPRCLNYTFRLPWYRRLARAIGLVARRIYAGILNLPYVFGRTRPAFYVLLGLLMLVVAAALTILLWQEDRRHFESLRPAESASRVHVAD